MKLTCEQVAAFNAQQDNPQFHPLTCGNRMDEAHRKYQAEHGGDFGQLIATEDGLACPVCEYRQPFQRWMIG